VKHLFPLLGATVLLSLPSGATCAATAANDQPLMQVFLGVAELDDQSGQWQNGARDKVDVDFSSLPAAGIEMEYLFGRGFVHWGLNPGGSIAWKEDNTKVAGRFTAQDGSTFLVAIDNSLFLSELHLGAYVRGRLDERITTYAAAGPMVMYGSMDVGNNDSAQSAENSTGHTESNSSDINIGYYGRAGIDFALDDKQQLGFSVRYLSSELDFDKTIGNVDIRGPQYVLTYTVQI
jgi:opacity protein-like surface antigen